MFLSLLLAFPFFSCSENCDQPSCLPGPEGTIRSGSKNLTVYTQVEDIDRITLIGDRESVVSLDGLDPGQGKYFSNWQTVSDTEYTSVLILVAGESFEIPIDGFPNTDQIRIEITEENGTLNISPLKFERCNDTPCD